MHIDCSNTALIKQTICENAHDMQEMILLDDSGTLTTNYMAKPIALQVKEKVDTYIIDNQNALDASVLSATNSAITATAQALIATTQAGIATTKADEIQSYVIPTAATYTFSEIDDGFVHQTRTELVTNGTFDTDTAWIKGTGWTISGGVASYSGSSLGNKLEQPYPGENNKTYHVKATLTMLATPNPLARVFIDIGGFGEIIGVQSEASLTNGNTYIIEGLVTPSVVIAFNIQIRSNANYQMNFNIDNLSIKETDSVDSGVILTLNNGSLLPTSDPAIAGEFWNDSGTVKISV